MIKSALLSLTFVLLLVGVQFYVNNVVLQGVILPKETALSEFDSKAVDVSLETVGTLTTMATLVLGATGGLWFTTYRPSSGTTAMPSRIRWLSFIAAGTATISIACGFIYERNLVAMLAHRLVSLQEPWLVWPLYAQIVAFLGALWALGVVVFEEVP